MYDATTMQKDDGREERAEPFACFHFWNFNWHKLRKVLPARCRCKSVGHLNDKERCAIVAHIVMIANDGVMMKE